ncbi:MAG: SLC26A/SulP transporter family protein [Anaerolineaceae bacterium]|nr:MAG: SLC26A/SulP transporter family protein [Anaerolineaceae bacterium]
MKTAPSVQRPPLSLRVILSSLTVGLVIGMLVVFIAVSFAALIFSGELDQFVPQGVGILLFGAFIMGAYVSLTSSLAGAISLPQDPPNVILAVVAASIAATMTSATPERTLATVVGAMMLSAVLTGLFFWLLGRFNLGQLVRYIPYPVVGGFLAGTGWLIVTGAIGVMIDVPFGPALFTPEALARWLPGLLFALTLLGLMRRYSHYLLLPACLLAGIALFYLLLFLSSGTFSSAMAGGWLLGPFPAGSLWQPVLGLVLAQADWSVIFGQAVTISTIMLVSAISLLLNASGLELMTRHDVDLNRELRSAGIGNLLASIGGSSPGFQSVSLSSLGYRLGASSRLVGLFSAVLCAIALFFGASALSVLPRIIAGGLLLVIGFSFLAEWLYDAYFKLSKLDYLLIWLILITVAIAGILEGIALGTIVAAIMFIYNYSRIKVARFALTGANYQSHVMRPPAIHQLLRDKGNDLYIVELQGYIFFGTAYTFVEQIRHRLQNPDLPPLRYLLLDFRLVTGIDSSATLSFSRLRQMVQGQEIQLVITNLSDRVSQEWELELFGEAKDTERLIFPNLDRGVAWCEEQMIDNFTNSGLIAKPKTLQQQLSTMLSSKDSDDPLADQQETPVALRMNQYVRRIEFEADQCFLREGEAVAGLYFIEEGQVIAKALEENGQEAELRTMEAGTVFGEIGIYTHLTATADVVAISPGVLFYLSARNLKHMDVEDPHLAIAFHRLIAGSLGEKLAQTSSTVRALQN